MCKMFYIMDAYCNENAWFAWLISRKLSCFIVVPLLMMVAYPHEKDNKRLVVSILNGVKEELCKRFFYLGYVIRLPLYNFW